MFKKISAAALIAACAAPAAAAPRSDFPGTAWEAGFSAAVPAPVPPARAAEKDWTVMVYLNGKNALEDNAMAAANKLESVGSSDRVNIVMELARIKGYSTDDGNWTGSRRYLVQKDANFNSVTSPVLQNFPKSDMGDYNHLADFGRWAKANFPAKHYLLIVWSGDGWKPKGRSLSYDEETYSRMTTPQLAQALAQIGKVDIFATDAGMMQLDAIDYEIKDYADLILGSEETSPGEGYPYGDMLYPLVFDPSMSPEDFGALAVDIYGGYYGTREPSNLSLVRAARMPRLRQLTDAWAAAAMASGETALIKKARDTAQCYVFTENKDLYDLVSIVAAGASSPDLKARSAELLAFIQNELVAANATVGDELSGSHGIAVYLPTFGYNAAYSQLAWARDGSWDEFAQWVLKIK